MASEVADAELGAQAAASSAAGVSLQPLDRAAVQKELDDTVSARKAMDSQLHNLRLELGRCQLERDTLVAKESELTLQLSSEMPSLGDFFAGKVRPDGPVMFELEQDQANPVKTLHCLDDSDEDDTSPGGDSMADPWEDGLDSFGIAKCRLCGVRVPVDIESIEKHSKECIHNEHNTGELLGKCNACGTLLPLNTESIELHQEVCPMKKIPPVPQVPVPGVSCAPCAPAQRGNRRTSSLWTLMLPMRLRGEADESGGYPTSNSSSGR